MNAALEPGRTFRSDLTSPLAYSVVREKPLLCPTLFHTEREFSLQHNLRVLVSLTASHINSKLQFGEDLF